MITKCFSKSLRSKLGLTAAIAVAVGIASVEGQTTQPVNCACQCSKTAATQYKDAVNTGFKVNCSNSSQSGINLNLSTATQQGLAAGVNGASGLVRECIVSYVAAPPYFSNMGGANQCTDGVEDGSVYTYLFHGDGCGVYHNPGGDDNYYYDCDELASSINVETKYKTVACPGGVAQ